MKDVAKSLHTVTVLVQVARLIMKTQNALPEAAIDRARMTLELDGRPDPHGLRAKALKALDSL